MSREIRTYQVAVRQSHVILETMVETTIECDDTAYDDDMEGTINDRALDIANGLPLHDWYVVDADRDYLEAVSSSVSGCYPVETDTDN